MYRQRLSIIMQSCAPLTLVQISCDWKLSLILGVMSATKFALCTLADWVIKCRLYKYKWSCCYCKNSRGINFICWEIYFKFKKSFSKSPFRSSAFKGYHNRPHLYRSYKNINKIFFYLMRETFRRYLRFQQMAKR